MPTTKKDRSLRRTDILPNSPAVWFLEQFHIQQVLESLLSDKEFVIMVNDHNLRVMREQNARKR